MSPAKLYDSTDGADAQSQAVLAYLRGMEGEFESDWLTEPRVARWENCREQGYVIAMRNHKPRAQLNIAFFEHRNSDEICAIEWRQITINSPTIGTAKFGDVYKDKYDVSHSVSHGCAFDMAEWITGRLISFREEQDDA
jgi:hypothetical protein